MVTYEEIAKEFDESLGYIQNDIRALCQGSHTVNYTVALLVGVACEVLEDAGAFRNKVEPLKQLMPDDDWRRMAYNLFEALRNGLAHKFDTKHIHVNGQVVQIYLSWSMQEIARVKCEPNGDELWIGTRVLGYGMCDIIEKFRGTLRDDPEARRYFKMSVDRKQGVKCDRALWETLKQKP